MAATFSIDSRSIGQDHPVFTIAEIGANHNGDLTLAKETVDAAKATGCDCVKFQTFSTENFCTNTGKTFTYRSQGMEVTENEYAMFKRLEFSLDEWADLMDYCKSKQILFMSTIQDLKDLDMMLKLGIKAIKVGSDDFNHLENIEIFAKTDLPLFISKGMADLDEVKRTLAMTMPLTEKLCVLHCVSLYPAAPQFLNLRQIPSLMETYPNVVWGYSDHSQGIAAAVGAVTLGACVIEKHFTLDRTLPGPDHWFSADPDEMSQLVDNLHYAQSALGSALIEPTTEEKAMRSTMRRRIVAAHDLTAGKILTRDDVQFKRSDSGAELEAWVRIEGAKLARNIHQDEGIFIEDVGSIT